MGVIYLDSCIVIYALEDRGTRGDAVRRRLAEAADSVIAISPLVTMECLVGPLREQNLSLHDHYVRTLGRLRRLALAEEHFVRAAALRAAHHLKTPDALHLAAAQLHGCDELWTNNARLASASHGLAVDVLTS